MCVGIVYMTAKHKLRRATPRARKKDAKILVPVAGQELIEFAEFAARLDISLAEFMRRGARSLTRSREDQLMLAEKEKDV